MSNYFKRLAHLNQLVRSIYFANPENPPMEILDITDPVVRNFLQILDLHEIRYLLVGRIAGVFYGEVQATPRLELWVEDPEDLQGFSVPGVVELATLEKDFETCYARAAHGQLEGMPITVLNQQDL